MNDRQIRQRINEAAAVAFIDDATVENDDRSGIGLGTNEAAEALALRVAKGSDGTSLLDSLSMRELQVLRRLAMGQTNREIARAYHISIKTVDTYRARLLKKLGLRNTAELSRFAMQNQLVEP